MTKIHRYAFNTGIISPDLWYRPDLARYHQALRVAENYTLLPHGPLKRRPGTRVQRRLSNALAGSTQAACHEFTVDAETYYWIVIYPYSSASQLQVISSSGAVLYTEDTDYLPAELERIQFKQTYDVMFIVHPNHDVRRLERTTTTDWNWTTHEFKGGPIGFINTDQTLQLSINAQQYDAATTYDDGDIIINGSTDTLTGNSINKYWYREGKGRGRTFTYYTTGIQPVSGTSTYQKNDLINISAAGNLSGQWRVVDKDSTYLYLNCGTYYNSQSAAYFNDYSGIPLGSSSLFIVGKGEQLYKSLQDSNTGNTPGSSPAWWEEVDNVSGPTTIYASEDYFTSSIVGKTIRFEYNDNLFAKGSFGTSDEDAVSPELPCLGSVQLTTEGGVWAGAIALEKSLDGGLTWEELGVITSYDGERNGTFTREISDFNALVRARMKERTAATSDTGCTYHLEVIGAQYIYATITSYTDAKTVQAEFSGFTTRYLTTWKWALGAFGGGDGFPGTLDFYEERMIVSGIPGWPGVVFGSQIDNWEVWQEGILADSPLKFTLGGAARNNVYWLLPMSRLVIGTDKSEHTLGSRDRDEAMSGGNRSSQKRADYGVAPVPAISSGDRVFYVESGARNIRSMAYYWEKEGWDSDDMMGVARHLLADYGVTHMAFQRAPYSTLWCRREDGKILTFTFSIKEEVAGWTIQDCGNVLALATASVTGGYDIGCVLKRDNGLYLETISPSNECRDFGYEMTSTHAPTFDLLALEAEDDLIVEDGIGSTVEDPMLSTSGSFIRIINPVTELVIKRDGAQLTADSDYVVTESGLIWLPDSSGTITVFDGAVQQTVSVDYVINLTSTYALIRVFNDDVDYSTLVVNYGGSPQTTLRFDQEDTRQIFVEQPVAGTWALVDDGRTMDDSEYEVIAPVNIFCPANSDYPETTLIGLEMVSEMSPTDLAASPDVGGPGGNVRSTLAEVYLVDAMGGEFSNNDGKTWTPISYVEKETVPGVKLPLFSGKKELKLTDGFRSDGVFVRIRNTSSRQMTIAAIGLNATRNRGKQ